MSDSVTVTLTFCLLPHVPLLCNTTISFVLVGSSLSTLIPYLDSFMPLLSDSLSYTGRLRHFSQSHSSPRYRPKPLPCGVVYLILFSIILHSLSLFSHPHIMRFLTINLQTQPPPRHPLAATHHLITHSRPPSEPIFSYVSLSYSL